MLAMVAVAAMSCLWSDKGDGISDCPSAVVLYESVEEGTGESGKGSLREWEALTVEGDGGSKSTGSVEEAWMGGEGGGG